MTVPSTTLDGRLAPVDGAGAFRVIRPGSRVLRRLGDLLGLPPAGADVAVTLRVATGESSDRWDRTFDGRHVVSWVRWDGMVLVERMGVIEVRFRVERPSAAAVALIPAGTRIAWGPIRLPLPRRLAPSIRCEVSAHHDGHHVAVTIATPGGTTVCAYDGTLVDAERVAP